MSIEIMLLCKKTLFCQYAIKILHSYYDEKKIIILSGENGSKIDEELYWHRPQYIIILSPWIIHENILSSAQKAAINFHPGSPRYPGSGCYNFAIYEKSNQYGVTCHHMNKKVDTGDIIMTSYFPIAPNETVESLKLKSMNHLLYIFDKIIHSIYTNDTLPVSTEKWLRLPYTKKQLDELCKIVPHKMTDEEINLRIRATDYCQKSKGAYIERGGNCFYHKSTIDTPLV